MNSEKCIKCFGPTKCGAPGCTCEPIPLHATTKDGKKSSYDGYVCGKCVILQQANLLRAQMQQQGLIVIDLSNPLGPE